MATITTTEYLDDNARTAGEAFTINGGELIIRTDTRIHANAPAGMTGSLGSITTSQTLGGALTFDASNVRWLAVDNVIGTSPAIGTTITQGSVSGYFLGFWSSPSAYTPTGDEMSGSGFIKFREVTGGTFSSGALTGISADATGEDVTGWIEVVLDQGADLTINNLGNGFKTMGGCFYLGETDGTGGQLFDIPSADSIGNAIIQGVEIETSAGSGIYEWYPALTSDTSTIWASGRMPSDARGKFVATATGSNIFIKYNGFGYLPESGCKVRMPNVIGRQCLTASRNQNTTPNANATTNPELITTSGGKIDWEYFTNDWYCNLTSAYSINISNCAWNAPSFITNTATKPYVDNLCVSRYQNNTSVALTITGQQNGLDFRNIKTVKTTGGTGGCIVITGCKSETEKNIFRNITSISGISSDRTVSTYSMAFTGNTNIDLDGLNQMGGFLINTTGLDCVFKNIDHIDRINTATTTSVGISAISLASSTNVLVDGVTFGLNETIAGCFPYDAILNSNNNTNVKLRNIGTRTSPLTTTNAGVTLGYIINQNGGYDSNVYFQRCYVSATRSSLILTTNLNDSIFLENCHSGSTQNTPARANNMIIRGSKTDYQSTAFPSTYGTHAHDYYLDDTNGMVVFFSNLPSPLTTQYVTLTGTAQFNSNIRCVLPNSGDSITIEMPYFAIGHTGFKNTAPSITTGLSTGEYTVVYQIDTGTGWNGSWKTLDTTNLTAETLDPAIGFKLKVKFTSNLTSANSYVDFMRIYTTTTATDQANYLYPLDFATITLNNVHVGCRVQLYDLTNSVELYNGISETSIFTYSTPYTDDFTMRVRLMCCDGTEATEFEEFEEEMTINGISRTVNQKHDQIYADNGINGSTVTGITIDDDNLLIETDQPTYSWQQIYAYETYWLSTEEGIRDEGRFIEAIDQANYKLFDFKLKNVSDPSAPLVITGGYGFDSNTGQAIDIIDTTGGTIFTSPDRVVPFSTGTIDVVTGDIADITANLTVINNGVKKASILVPHSQDL